MVQICDRLQSYRQAFHREKLSCQLSTGKTPPISQRATAVALSWNQSCRLALPKHPDRRLALTGQPADQGSEIFVATSAARLATFCQSAASDKALWQRLQRERASHWNTRAKTNPKEMTKMFLMMMMRMR